MSEAETVLNAQLAGLLDGMQTDEGVISAEPEHRVGSGWIDVLVTVGGQRIAVEAKIAKGLASSALDRAAAEGAGQAADRVANGEADFGVVVVYPPDCAAADLASIGDLRWARAVTEGQAIGSFSALLSGDYRGLGDFLGGMQRIGNPEQTAKDLEQTLKQAVRRLTPTQQLSLIDRFHKVKETGKKGDAEREQACVRVMLMVAAATMFHVKLQERLRHLPADKLPRPEWISPDSPGRCLDDADSASAFAQAWKRILEVDYRPIFEAAREALVEMLGDTAFSLAVKDVARKAISLGAATAHLRYDLLGSVFHRVLDTARHDGSYYTTAAAATLLTGLAVRDDHVDWSDPDAAARLRVCDPACGSGTLLLSAVERIERLCADAQASLDADPDDRQLRLAEMIEHSIWGFDINATAIHLAATSLGLAAPDVSFRQMRLFTSQFGRAPDQTIHLGSLDLLTGGAQLQLDTSWGRTEHRQAELGEHEEAAGSLGQPGNKVDVVVMNPPFTRDSLRHDQLGKADEAAVKKAEKELLAKKAPAKAKAARLHSSGGMFLLLADHLADERSGTVGFVLPAVVATSTGNEDFRKYLAGRFAIEYLVMSHDPDRIHFSGNTDISEMLIVARRAKTGPPPGRNWRSCCTTRPAPSKHGSPSTSSARWQTAPCLPRTCPSTAWTRHEWRPETGARPGSCRTGCTSGSCAWSTLARPCRRSRRSELAVALSAVPARRQPWPQAEGRCGTTSPTSSHPWQRRPTAGSRRSPARSGLLTRTGNSVRVCCWPTDSGSTPCALPPCSQRLPLSAPLSARPLPKTTRTPRHSASG